MEDLIRHGSERLRTAVMVIGPDLDVIARAGDVDDRLAARARAALGDGQQGFWTTALNGAPLIIDPDRSDVATLLLATPISLRGEALGFVVAEVTADQLAEATPAMAELSELVAVELVVRRRLVEAAEVEEREVFLDLLEARALAHVMHRAKRLGSDLLLQHLPIACRVVRAGAQVSQEQALGCLVSLVKAALVGGTPGDGRAIIGQTEPNEFVAFLPAVAPDRLDSVCRHLVARAAAVGAVVTIGAGPPCTSPDNFSKQALRARWTARILELTGVYQRMVSFDDLGVYALLFNAEQKDELDAFVTRWIGPLVEYDRAQKADLTATLGALLEGRSYRQTAEELLIHISTLKYRIGRIKALLRRDYKDPDIRFNLQLAIRLSKVRDQSLSPYL